MKKLALTAAVLAAMMMHQGCTTTTAKETETTNTQQCGKRLVERTAECEQYIDYVCYEYYCAALERGETEEDYTTWLLDIFCEGDEYDNIVCEAYGIYEPSQLIDERSEQ